MNLLEERARRETVEWLRNAMCGNNIARLDLTCKQFVRHSNGTFEKLDDIKLGSNIRRYLRALDTYFFKNAVRRYGKRLQRVPVIEKKNDRFHVHLLIEIPLNRIDGESFYKTAQRMWMNTLWADEVSRLQEVQWLDRSISYNTKDGLSGVVWEEVVLH
jgi:hypothetical protein